MKIAANWKMNMDRASVRAWVEAVASSLGGAAETVGAAAAEVIVFPPSVLIDTVIKTRGIKSRDDAGIEDGVLAVGGQNCHHDKAGAYTGEVSASMLVDAGCSWVLLGHSERRAGHAETDEMVAKKAVSAVRAGLRVMVCVGESLEARHGGRAQEVVAGQVSAFLSKVREEVALSVQSFVLAYEPIWAIGTGQVAGLDDIAEMHDHIRAVLLEHDEGYGSVDILYGGSVKADNAASLFGGLLGGADGASNIGGALVGGASLNADDFIAIVQSAYKN